MLDELTYVLRAHIATETSAEFIQMLDKITYTLRAHIDAATSAEFIQILDDITYVLRAHIDAATSTEFIQILDDITYILRAHQHHNISGVQSNTRGDHVRPEGTPTPQHQWSSFKCLTRSRTI
jgi:uncharacterized tellurite resistance protein B-like protein